MMFWFIWPHNIQTGKCVREKEREYIFQPFNLRFCTQESFIGLSSTSEKYLCKRWCVCRSWTLSCILGSSVSRTAAYSATSAATQLISLAHVHALTNHLKRSKCTSSTCQMHSLGDIWNQAHTPSCRNQSLMQDESRLMVVTFVVCEVGGQEWIGMEWEN